jgi:hypothetical protein
MSVIFQLFSIKGAYLFNNLLPMTAGIAMKEVGIIMMAGAAMLSWLSRSPRPCENNSCSNGGIT